MDPLYKIKIPKPCHEDWGEMTPQEKGRFCDSCSKTVIDFTKLNTYEVQDFINENRDKKLCGHFKQTQLNSINLFIPHQIVKQKLSFNKLFLLALLITMGTSLLNCTNKNGERQKIDSVDVIEKASDTTDFVLGGLPRHSENDTLNHSIDRQLTTDDVVPEAHIKGEIPIVMGIIIPPREANAPYSIYGVDTPPEFKDTPQDLSFDEKRDYFQKKMAKFFQANFMTHQGPINLEGRQRISTKFIIDSLGKAKDIKVRAPHLALEKETLNTLAKLPQLTPAKLNGENVSMSYSLPIIFQVQD